MSYQRIQPYPVVPRLPVITHHEQLLPDSVELARIDGKLIGDDLIVLVKRNNQWLSILRARTRHLKTGDKYRCYQFDFPLGMLTWFPQALADFIKPPAEGGLRAGALSSIDYEVEGEMLCVQRTTTGYSIINWSRSRDRDPEGYRATSLDLEQEFLYEGGFLELIKQLGERYRNGEL